MSGDADERPALRTKSAEVAVALILMALAALIAFDAQRIGARWAADGPQSGYFPFHVALILLAASAVNLVRALRLRPESDAPFVRAGQLRLVLAVLAPSAVFVAAVPWTGMYVAATVFVMYFMHRLGGYRWWKSAVAAAATGVIIFVLFEIWFKVPLPKGPLERWLGVG
ncbi:MAG: tripartite tricarboxylate transporter TctB family protein [Elioraea sp.]|nr:tripartite tricarboxylate transporter TctB family protein [Elioraea sp.]